MPTETDRSLPEERSDRRRWIALLATAPRATLEAAWQETRPEPAHTFVRRPEIGASLVRGRAGGTGERFNLGEITITRCSARVQTTAEGFHVGHAYILGRDRRKAELCALFDALCQDGQRLPAIERHLLAPLAQAKSARERQAAEQVASSRVDFFTMVRGD